MHTICRETSLCSTHDRLAELIGVGCDIAGTIETLYSGFLAFIDDEASLGIFLWGETIDDTSKWS